MSNRLDQERQDMSQIPDPIETEFETNEGFHFKKPESELLIELIEAFNELVIYLDSISERL